MAQTRHWQGAPAPPKEPVRPLRPVRPVRPARRGRTTQDVVVRCTRAAIEGRDEPSEDAPILRLHPGDPVPGTKYRVVRRLGSGGMGVVYQGRHTATERHAAVKVLRKGNSADKRVLEAFRQEARIASQIGSEYIVQSLDFTELPGGRLIYVMELVEGESVADLLGGGPIPAPRAIGILRQIARGLADAHEAGVIHRDVKPENVMLERRGDRRDAVRILDFGIASMASQFVSGSVDGAGTPEFVAPEVILGQPATPSSDLYSLGCMAYEMLTGTTPFRSADIDDVLRGHLEDQPRPIEQVPRRLSSTILRCLSKRPEDRYTDMRDFEASLLEAQVDAGFVTEWDHLPLPPVDPERRVALVDALSDREPPSPSRWSAAAAAGAVLVALVGLSWAALSGDDDSVARDVHERAAAEAADDVSAMIGEVTRRAREAAQAGRYIYPPYDAPRANTAYGEILKLEALQTAEARARAAELRLEFAAELRRVADHYHALRPSSPLVAEYYAEVLTLMPSDAVARARVGRSDAQLAELRRRAAESTWDPGALLAFEPLAILGEDDPVAQRRRIATYREALQATQTTPAYAADFDALLVVRSPTGRPPETAQSGETEPTSASVADVAPARAVDEPEPRGTAAHDDATRKRTATRLADKGRQALRSGNATEAERAFASAIELNDRLSSAHDGLAQIYFSRSNFRRAARHAKKAVRSSPGNLDYRILLGDALYRLGALEDALHHYLEAAAGGRQDAKRRAEKIRKKL